MKSDAQIIEEEIEEMKREASFYRGIASNVIKIDMKRAICFDKPVVIEGEVEMEDVYGEEHMVFVRPISETVALIVPRREGKMEYFDIYVYSNKVWIHRSAGHAWTESYDYPLEVIRELLKRRGG